MRSSLAVLIPSFLSSVALVTSLSSCSARPQPAIRIAPAVNGSAAVQGTVTHDGAPLPGATVSLSCVQTNGVRKAVTDTHGRYSFLAAASGPCTLRFELVGLAAVNRTLEARSGSVATVDADLRVAGVAETITVTASAPAMPVFGHSGTFVPPAVSYRTPPAAARAGVSAGRASASHVVASTAVATAEEYTDVGENKFFNVKERPISTFASDVDTASYTNVRRFLKDGSLPPPAAVRIEEMVNYFRYDDPPPVANGPFTVATELATCPWRTDRALLRVAVRSRAIDVSTAPPHNFVFLIDVSGSMQDPWKLPLVKKGFQMLTGELRGQDRVAIVVYAGHEALVLPSTPGSDKDVIRAAIENLTAGGSTAGEAGIRLAYRIARENFIKGGNNRVVLATDGDFNVGVSSEQELEALIVAEREHGIFLTTLGYGRDNLKDGRLELLADKGNGNYHYVDSDLEARRVMVEQLGGTFVTLAKDLKLQVEFDAQSVERYRLVGYENRILNTEDFDDDRKDAGDVGSGESVTALYELELRAEPHRPVGLVRLRYKEPQGSSSARLEFPAASFRAPIEAASNDMRLAAAVAQLGLLLRKSQFAGTASFDSVLALARSALGPDADGSRREFVQLAETAQRLAATAGALPPSAGANE